MGESTAVREVEVRTWPERTDCLVIDVYGAELLTHFYLRDDRSSAAWNPLAGYEDRKADALCRTEMLQDDLRRYFELDDDHTVKLEATPTVRERYGKLLEEHGLSLDSVELCNLKETVVALKKLPLLELYTLLCDWHDVVERHYPAGQSYRDPASWVHRAHPEVAVHHFYLATGEEQQFEVGSEEEIEAYRQFVDLVDVDLAHLSFGHVIRWVYFHRSEFPERPLPALRAARELRSVAAVRAAN